MPSVQKRVSSPRTSTRLNRTHEVLMVLNCTKKEIQNHIRRKVKYFQSLHKNNLEQTSVLSNLGLEIGRTACLGGRLAIICEATAPPRGHDALFTSLAEPERGGLSTCGNPTLKDMVSFK